MPVILRHKGYRFFFFSNEETPRKPFHIHVREGERIAKFQLEPDIQLLENYGFSPRQLAEIWDITFQHHDFMKEKWIEYFGN